MDLFQVEKAFFATGHKNVHGTLYDSASHPLCRETDLGVLRNFHTCELSYWICVYK